MFACTPSKHNGCFTSYSKKLEAVQVTTPVITHTHEQVSANHSWGHLPSSGALCLVVKEQS